MEVVVMINTEEEMVRFAEQLDFLGVQIDETATNFPRYFVGDFKEGMREISLSQEELEEKNIFLAVTA